MTSKEMKYSELPKEIKLQDDVNTLLDVNEELRQRIDKAIEELDRQITFCENDSQDCYEVCNQTITFLKRIKNILERSDKDE